MIAYGIHRGHVDWFSFSVWVTKQLGFSVSLFRCFFTAYWQVTP